MCIPIKSESVYICFPSICTFIWAIDMNFTYKIYHIINFQQHTIHIIMMMIITISLILSYMHNAYIYLYEVSKKPICIQKYWSMISPLYAIYEVIFQCNLIVGSTLNYACDVYNTNTIWFHLIHYIFNSTARLIATLWLSRMKKEAVERRVRTHASTAFN